MVRKAIRIESSEGLHARPATEIAKVAMASTCELRMYREGDTSRIYQPKSILSIMTMGAGKGDVIVFEADGTEEDQVLCDIEHIILDVQ